MKHLLLILTVLIGIQPLWSRADERPNVVVFLVDDMGLMDTSVPFLADEDGKPVTHPLNKYYQTLNMETLATQGIRFETLNMWHYAVHSPYQPDPRFVAKYDDALGKSMPAFASLIEGMDKSLGDLLAHLNKTDQAENTLIVFLGDNGSAAPVTGDKHGIISSAPLRSKKGSHYEGGMRVPFIAAWAKVNLDHPLQQQFPVAQNAMTTKAFATIEDLMPTVLALTGTEAPESHVMDGINILPSLAKADTPTGRHHFLMHFPHQHCSSNFTAYREEGWKIIRHYDSGTVELFDLTSDPTESSDLSKTRPERLRAMQSAMQKRLDDAEAQYIEK